MEKKSANFTTKKSIFIVTISLISFIVFGIQISCFGDDYDISMGTPFEFSSTGYTGTPHACKIDDTHFLCAFGLESDEKEGESGWVIAMFADMYY